MSQSLDDEINLVELFQTLWIGKWKIISIALIFALLGIVYSINEPNSFEVSTDIKESEVGTFIEYTAVNDILTDHGFSSGSKSNAYLLNSSSVFQLVVNEFNDYKEMVGVLKKDEFVNESIKNLTEIKKQKVFVNFAKNFKIKPPMEKINKNWSLFYEWHDINDGQRLFEDALKQTLENVKKTIIEDVSNLATTIDLRTNRRLDSLKLELSLIRQNEKVRLKKNLRYLLEQTSIARELGVENNGLDTSALSAGQQGNLSLSINSTEIPFYLRGFKAIDKSISLIKSRSTEEELLMTPGYYEKLLEISSLENGLDTTHLRNALQVIERDNPDKWVDFDFLLSDSKSQKKSKLIIIIAIVLGGMLGIMFVMITNPIIKQKLQVGKVEESSR